MLKKKCSETVRERTLDELDEYVMLLETHRIKLVSKLKAVFDRFDSGLASSSFLFFLFFLLIFYIKYYVLSHLFFIYFLFISQRKLANLVVKK